MKARRWLYGCVAIVVAGVSLAILRGPTDDLAPFRPYIVSERHVFYEHGPFGGASEPAQEWAWIDIEGIPAGEMHAIMSSGFFLSRGWKCSSEALNPILFKGTDERDSSRERVFSTYTYSRNVCFLTATRPLSKFEVVLLRLKHFGEDPFNPPYGGLPHP